MKCEATLELEGRTFVCDLEDHRGPHTCSFQKDTGKGIVKLRWHGDDRVWNFRVYGDYVDPEFTLQEKGIEIDQPVSFRSEKNLLLEVRVSPSAGVGSVDEARDLIQQKLNGCGIFPRHIQFVASEG